MRVSTPASVASGWLDATMPFFAMTENWVDTEFSNEHEVRAIPQNDALALPILSPSMGES
jgi:hypothetical protein